MPSAEVHNLGPIHILVGDNSRIHSQLLAEALKRDPRFIVVGAPSSSEEFLEIASRTRPDVVIISVNLDDEATGGITLLREFHDRYPETPAVMLLDSPQREVVLDAFRSGARGIFSKHESLENLCKCVCRVVKGQVWASSREVKFALDALSSVPRIRATNAGGLKLLSRRELQVVHHLAEGLTNREIGDRLGLSPHTIKNYLLKIFDKLGVCNRVELLFLRLSQPMPTIPKDKVNGEQKRAGTRTKDTAGLRQ
jgi:DNA-binding NarL/FixJ family response regulator